MNEETLYRFAGWSAYFNAAIFILSMIALMLFFSIGGIWGRINDSLSIIWMLSYLPLAVALFLMNRDFNAKLSACLTVAGASAAESVRFTVYISTKPMSLSPNSCSWGRPLS